jgi:hypothetical protein
VVTAHARRTLEACAVEHSALLRGVHPGDVLVQVTALLYATCYLPSLLSASASCVVDFFI